MGRSVMVFVIITLLSASDLLAQPSQAMRDSINRITRVDYEQMLGQLGLKPGDMRPGPSGNPSAPNAANRFEDKVNSYTLPDPLTFRNGGKVLSASAWKQRRLEIIEDFENEIYGR